VIDVLSKLAVIAAFTFGIAFGGVWWLHTVPVLAMRNATTELQGRSSFQTALEDHLVKYGAGLGPLCRDPKPLAARMFVGTYIQDLDRWRQAHDLHDGRPLMRFGLHPSVVWAESRYTWILRAQKLLGRSFGVSICISCAALVTDGTGGISTVLTAALGAPTVSLVATTILFIGVLTDGRAGRRLRSIAGHFRWSALLPTTWSNIQGKEAEARFFSAFLESHPDADGGEIMDLLRERIIETSEAALQHLATLSVEGRVRKPDEWD
jgi:hypothetical protein